MIELRQLAGFHARNVGAARGARAICDVFITPLDVHDRVHPCYMVHKPIVFAAADLATVKLHPHDQSRFQGSLAETSFIGRRCSHEPSFSRINIASKCRELNEPIRFPFVSLISGRVSHA